MTRGADPDAALVREALKRTRQIQTVADRARAIGVSYSTTLRWTKGTILTPLAPETRSAVQAFLGGDAVNGPAGAAAAWREIARVLRQQAEDAERRAAAIERSGG